MPRSVLLVVLLVHTACPHRPGDDPDAGSTITEMPDAASTTDTPDAGGEAVLDASMPDAAVASCGNGSVEGDEVCDGNARDCTELAGAYGGGMASCRSDCSGWVVTTCMLMSGPRFETVKPAERDPRWANARCNDGTPFAAYVRLNPSSANWVIVLEGGVMCEDNAIQCSQRAVDDPDLITTLPTADRALGMGPSRGILTRDPMLNPDFASANHVHAHYCSSDFWVGATTEKRPTTGDAQGWYFNGRSNVRALIEILKERYNLDDTRPETRVLLSGTSAGAHGAHFNARAVTGLLPTTSAGGRIKLFLDAGWMFDWDQPAHRIINTTTSDREVWRAARTFWGATLDEECEAAAGDPIDCWFGPGWYPHIKALMPVFVQQSRRDGSFGGFLHGPMLDFALWQTEAEASLVDVEWLWSGDDVYHVLSGSDVGFHEGVAPNTLQETLGSFWNGGPPERVLW